MKIEFDFYSKTIEIPENASSCSTHAPVFADSDFEDTLASLQIASRAKNVENLPRVNEVNW